jgi:hypothetical protein
VSAPEIHLFEPLIFLLLVADVSADRVLVATNRVDEESSSPKMPPYEIAFALSIDPGQMNRALALDIPDDLRHRIFRRYRQQHVHVIGPRLSLPSGAQAAGKPRPDDVVVPDTTSCAELSYSSIGGFPFVCVAAHVGTPPRDPLKRQTVTATPAKPGGLPLR